MQDRVDGYSGYGYFHMFIKNKSIKEMEKTKKLGKCSKTLEDFFNHNSSFN